MKTLLIGFLLLIHQPVKTSTTVYICSGAKGKKYHLQAHCRGLSSCQHRIIKMKLSDAQAKGYTLCGWEK
jgi:hypothetical protein